MNAVKHLRAGRLWSPDGFEESVQLTFAAGRVSAWDALSPRPPSPDGVLGTDGVFGGVLDAHDGIVIPGLVDVQVNGALGWSFQSQHRPHFDAIVAHHLAAGTTTFLPTLITADEDTLTQSLSVLAAYCAASQATPGTATLPGIHLEGPFLSPEKAGAHDPAALRLPDRPLLERFLAAANGQIRIVTLAPELPGAPESIRRLAERGVLVSAGHSAATFAQMQAAADAGLTLITHAGNASDWPHRAPRPEGFWGSEPGLVGALLADQRLSGSVILDGFHFHPALVPPLAKLKAPHGLLLTSDASTVAGCPPGEYEGGGLLATVHPQGYATSGRDGRWLAGSTITLLDAVRRAVSLSGLSLHTAVGLASATPAHHLGLGQRKGHLGLGADADCLVLNEDLSLRAVIVGGRIRE
ncbi:MAG: N-acetylglucosamine-6-phosphate deacetylase [Caldilineaceae bacterium]|nr:N-acetylglucosamine-6-phosphate deacetylase [Caldilineaceae bacterium]